MMVMTVMMMMVMMMIMMMVTTTMIMMMVMVMMVMMVTTTVNAWLPQDKLARIQDTSHKGSSDVMSHHRCKKNCSNKEMKNELKNH